MKETLPQIIRHPDQIQYLPEWWSSLDPGRNPLSDECPWISFSAIDFLENIITKDMNVYEYGSGGSTLFFARRAHTVISTEHDRNWYGKVHDDINNKGLLNCEVRLFEPVKILSASSQDAGDPDSYSSGGKEYDGMSFKNYASSIDSYPDAHFDIIFIDGRSRPSCFKHALRKVKEKGFIVLDNAEIPHYVHIHNSLNNGAWSKHDFLGLFPYLYHFSETCIWQKIRQEEPSRFS